MLLFGSIISGMQQAAEAAVVAMETVWPGNVPDWLTYKDEAGYVPLVVMVLLFTYPLCMVKQMRAVGDKVAIFCLHSPFYPSLTSIGLLRKS